MSLFDKLKNLNNDKKDEQPEGDEANVMDRLRALGDEVPVNPPEGETIQEQEGIGEQRLETPEQVEVEAEEKTDKQEESEGETCPTCGKKFKRLSMHKCKGEQEQQEEQKAEQKPKVVVEQFDGFVLMLDVLFEKNAGIQPQLFADIIAPLCEAVSKENNALHWGAVDFGKGGPLLAAKVQRWLRETKPTGIILADSSTPELRACKEVLKRAAITVVRSVR